MMYSSVSCLLLFTGNFTLSSHNISKACVHQLDFTWSSVGINFICFVLVCFVYMWMCVHMCVSFLLACDIFSSPNSRAFFLSDHWMAIKCLFSVQVDH